MHCILKYNIVYYAFLWVALSFLLFFVTGQVPKRTSMATHRCWSKWDGYKPSHSPAMTGVYPIINYGWGWLVTGFPTLSLPCYVFFPELWVGLVMTSDDD